VNETGQGPAWSDAGMGSEQRCVEGFNMGANINPWRSMEVDAFKQMICSTLCINQIHGETYLNGCHEILNR
jgi:hypothetical protein